MKLKFEGLILKGERIAVALSGGKDSVALFYALCEAEREYGIEVCAINVEHGIRGEASEKDSAFVKKLCDNAGKRLLSYKIDVPAYALEKGLSTETAAREMRYACFLRAVREGFCDKVATAHHADDNAESVLLNVFRGSGIKGLGGIPEKAYNGAVIRPMLGVSRADIEKFVSERGLPYVTDESNYDDAYSRNFLRNRIIPLVKQRYPDFEKSVSRLSEICRETDEYIEKCAKKAVNTKNGEAEILLSEVSEKPIFSRAVIEAAKTAGLEKDYEAVHVEAVSSLIGAQAGSCVDLPHGFRAERSYKSVIIYKVKEEDPFDFPFQEGKFDLPSGVLRIEKTFLPNVDGKKKAAFFAQEKAKGVLYVNVETVEGSRIRTRASGDMFRKFGSGGRPLKEYFIDEKIERRRRDGVPVCAGGSEIYFVAGLEISSLAAVGADDKEAYRITYENKTED